MTKLIDKVKAWGIAKCITGPNGKGTLLAQLSKTQEELTETRDAAVKWEIADCRKVDSDHEMAVDAWFELKDGIGDTAVTLILLAEMAELDLYDRVQAAYDEIDSITGANGKGTLLDHLSNTQEELTKTRDAAVVFNLAMEYADIKEVNKSMHELKDGIGDTAVTLIRAAKIAGLDFQDCLQAAYDEIAGRTGKMIGGQFVKDS
jgi:NTP pyrophosphatase (non-canonical NTP hydrolase)